MTYLDGLIQGAAGMLGLVVAIGCAVFAVGVVALKAMLSD